MTDDASGRPIAFVFAGTTFQEDGSAVLLTRDLLRKSVNIGLARAGFAYPLYYNTLFATLREEVSNAIAYAKKKRLGYWPTDKTTIGVTVRTSPDLPTIPPIWPKLWRRLEEFFQRNTSLSQALSTFLNAVTNESMSCLSWRRGGSTISSRCGVIPCV